MLVDPMATVTSIDVRTLVHRAAHELKNPLSGLMMLLSAARAMRPDDPELRQRVGAAIGAARRIDRLTRALVEYVDAGVTVWRFEAVDSRALAVEVLRELAPPSANVEIGPLPAITADRSGLRRVFRALADNAIRYSASAAPHIAVDAERTGTTWTFTIADRGPGLPPDECRRVFEPFVRLHSYDDVPGEGLGLAICESIVGGHGGSMGIRPREEGGSVAWFTLPAEAAPSSD